MEIYTIIQCGIRLHLGHYLGLQRLLGFLRVVILEQLPVWLLQEPPLGLLLVLRQGPQLEPRLGPLQVQELAQQLLELLLELVLVLQVVPLQE